MGDEPEQIRFDKLAQRPEFYFQVVERVNAQRRESVKLWAAVFFAAAVFVFLVWLIVQSNDTTNNATRAWTLLQLTMGALLGYLAGYRGSF